MQSSSPSGLERPLLLGLGSNLGDRLSALRLGVDRLTALSSTQLLRVSSVYETPPFGGVEQPPFLNAVAVLRCGLEPEKLLACLKGIEREAGRLPGGVRWGPRALDLDILSYGEQLRNAPELTIPHAGLAERAFVLVPLVEVCRGTSLVGLTREGRRAAVQEPDSGGWATPEWLLEQLPEAEREAVCRVAPPLALWPATL